MLVLCFDDECLRDGKEADRRVEKGCECELLPR